MPTRPRNSTPLLAAFCAALCAQDVRAAALQPGHDADAANRDTDGANEIEHDDPLARMRARAQEEEQPTPDALARKLLAIRRERDTLGLVDQNVLRQQLRNGAARVQGNVWLNLGPSSADNDFNGVTYNSVDSGRLRSILPHPSNPNILFVATSGGGVWKTYDAGATWIPLTDGIGNTSVGALAMDPQNPDVLHLALGDPYDLAQPGVLTSTDGGVTWSDPVFPSGTVKDGAGAAVTVKVSQTTDLKVDPGDSSHLLLASSVGLFQSNDAGKSYAQVTLPGITSRAHVWSIVNTGPGTWLVAAQNINATTGSGATSIIGAPMALFQSVDSGKTWTALPLSTSTYGRGTLAVGDSTVGKTAGHARVYLLAGKPDGSATADVLRTDDSGATWKPLGVNAGGRPIVSHTDSPGDNLANLDVLGQQAWYGQAIVVDPLDPNAVFVGGQFGMIRTKNGGTTWSYEAAWLPVYTPSLPYLHADHHVMAVGFAGGKRRNYFGTDGGLFASTDAYDAGPGNIHFSDSLNKGLVTHLLYSIGCAHPNWPAELQGFVIGGLQDNGTRRRSLTSANGPDVFDQVYGGDGMGVGTSVKMDGTVPALVLASTYGGAITASTDGGFTFSSFTRISGAPFVTPITQDVPAADGLTFLSYSQSVSGGAGAVIYKSSGGSPFTALSTTVTSWTGTVGTDFTNWSGNALVNHVDTHPKAAGVYGVAAGAGYTFVSTDGGVTWTGAHPVGNTTAHPDTYIGSIVTLAFDPTDATGKKYWAGSVASVIFQLSVVLAGGTPTGVPVPDDFGHLLYTGDGGSTWQPMVGSAGHRLPNVPVRRIATDPQDANTLYVATDAGLYRTTDHGATFDRFGVGLPVVQISDFCFGNGTMKIATYGRGFWQLDTTAAGSVAGVRGHGDLDFNRRLDAFDLVDLVAAMGTSNTSDAYRPEADLTGTKNLIDDEDLKLFLSRFGGAP